MGRQIDGRGFQENLPKNTRILRGVESVPAPVARSAPKRDYFPDRSSGSLRLPPSRFRVGRKAEWETQ